SVRGQSAPEHYPRSLHDALPIWPAWRAARRRGAVRRQEHGAPRGHPDGARRVGFAHGPPFLEIEGKYVLKIVVATAKPEATKHRSEEHTSELQSRENLVCRLLLE